MSPLWINQCSPSGTGRGIGHLLDHTAMIYRPSETLGVARQTVRTYEEVVECAKCTLRRKNTGLVPEEGGLQDSGSRTVYFEAGVDVQERDVIELLTGPSKPARLEVESVAKPRGHHIECKVVEYHGKLPSDEVGS